MPNNVKRRLLTDQLLTWLTTALETGGADEIKVGDHEAPDGGGWVDQEGTGEFVNYVVLTALPADGSQGSIGGPQEETFFPYALTAIGISRESAEGASDEAREALLGARRVDVSTMRIGYIDINGYGAVERFDSTDPPFYAITDTIVVHVSQS